MKLNKAWILAIGCGVISGLIVPGLLKMQADAQSLSVPNTFSAGSKIVASQINANFNAITSWGNGNVGTDNIASGSITNAKMAADSVNTSQLVDLSVTSGKLAQGAVGPDKISATTFNGAASHSNACAWLSSSDYVVPAGDSSCTFLQSVNNGLTMTQTVDGSGNVTPGFTVASLPGPRAYQICATSEGQNASSGEYSGYKLVEKASNGNLTQISGTVIRPVVPSGSTDWYIPLGMCGAYQNATTGSHTFYIMMKSTNSSNNNMGSSNADASIYWTMHSL